MFLFTTFVYKIKFIHRKERYLRTSGVCKCCLPNLLLRSSRRTISLHRCRQNSGKTLIIMYFVYYNYWKQNGLGSDFSPLVVDEVKVILQSLVRTYNRIPFMKSLKNLEIQSTRESTMPVMFESPVSCVRLRSFVLRHKSIML